MHGHTFLIRCVDIGHVRRVCRVLPCRIRWRLDQVVATDALRRSFVVFPVLTNQVLTVGHWLTVRGLIVDLNRRCIWRIGHHFQRILVLFQQVIRRGNRGPHYLIAAGCITRHRWRHHRLVATAGPVLVPLNRLGNQITGSRFRHRHGLFIWH